MCFPSKFFFILSIATCLVLPVLSFSTPTPNSARNDGVTESEISGLVSRRNVIQGKILFSGVSTTLVLAEIVRPDRAKAIGSSPELGVRAPDFSLPNSRGTGTTTLDSLTQEGKWTVLYFYPGAFTSGCTLEARGFQRDLDQYRALNAQVVGVSVDPVEKNAQFCTVEKLDFYLLTDERGEVSKNYGSALSVPGFGTFSNRQTYIIDPRGILRWVFTDVESRVAIHSSEVLSKLKELTDIQGQA